MLPSRGPHVILPASPLCIPVQLTSYSSTYLSVYLICLPACPPYACLFACLSTTPCLPTCVPSICLPVRFPVHHVLACQSACLSVPYVLASRLFVHRMLAVQLMFSTRCLPVLQLASCPSYAWRACLFVCSPACPQYAANLSSYLTPTPAYCSP